MATITIDGVDFDVDALSVEAKTQLANMQVTDQKIVDLQTQLAIYQTARAAYARELLTLLPEVEARAKSAVDQLPQ